MLSVSNPPREEIIGGIVGESNLESICATLDRMVKEIFLDYGGI